MDYYDYEDELDDENDEGYDPENRPCWQCGGEGWGVIGDKFPSRYGGLDNGEVVDCPCCGGTGLAKDCTYW